MKAVAWISALCILWVFVLGNSWAAIGFAEGAGYLTATIETHGFDLFYPARDYAMVLMQVPLAAAMRLGVTDLHLLTRLLTLGTLGLPALLYSYALVRARHDSLVLAAVIAVMSAAYMTTCYFTIGEYNTAYAIAVVMTTVVVTSKELHTRDAALLLALAVLGLRTYEVFAYLGPALGLLLVAAWQRDRPPAAWRAPRNAGRFASLVVFATAFAFAHPLAAPIGLLLILTLTAVSAWRGRLTPGAAATLHLAAAAVCFAASPLALTSIFGWVSRGHLDETVSGSRQFVHNLPFDLQLLAVASVVATLAVRRRPLRVALIGSAVLALLLVAMLPLLEPLHPLLRPTVIAHYLARTVCGPFVVAILAGLTCCRMGRFAPLKKRADARSGALLAFALASLVAVQVPDAWLTRKTVRYMDQLRAMTAATSDVVIEDSPLAAYPEIVSLRDLSWLAIQVRVLAVRPQRLPNFKRRRDGQQTASSLPELPSRFVWRQ